ncbi:MAG TPA: ABC transporter permease subunit [Candidatus Deferrimicrobiaceae bacterium]|jgi:ABC-type transport system involved in multi-copper enzyme maturation permease subunit
MLEGMLPVAANTFRETIRNKILYAILAFALFVIGMTNFLANLSFGDLARIIIDLGLSSIHIFGVVMAIFIGITLVSQEIDRKTVYIILSKPVPRWEFVVGKALGLCATLGLITLFMTIVLFIVHAGYRYGGSMEPGIFVAATGIYMELVLLTCLASLFSTFTTPVLSAIFTLSMFLIGHITRDLLFFGAQSGSRAVAVMGKTVYFLLPNLELFNFKNNVVYGQARSVSLLLAPAGYMVCYCAAVLSLACFLFSRKDFK